MSKNKRKKQRLKTALILLIILFININSCRSLFSYTFNRKIARISKRNIVNIKFIISGCIQVVKLAEYVHKIGNGYCKTFFNKSV